MPSNPPGVGGDITPEAIDITRGAIDASQVPDEKKSKTLSVEDVEHKLIESGKIASFILKPTDIQRIWKSTKMKQELVLFFQELYKPKSQFDQERVEYNQINILAEYVLYNIIFAKNELMYDELKVAVIVDMFWRLLEFDPEDPNEKKDKENTKE